MSAWGWLDCTAICSWAIFSATRSAACGSVWIGSGGAWRRISSKMPTVTVSEIQGSTRNTRDNSPGVAGCIVVSVPVIGGVSRTGAGGLNLEKTIPQRRHSGPSSCSNPHLGQVRAVPLGDDEDCIRMKRL
ncbi:MAG: hypothetical protein HY281_12290 [Nitrospirae bacterium]|nr:hypothetical protein [Nitrospirota bacterium]